MFPAHSAAQRAPETRSGVQLPFSAHRSDVGIRGTFIATANSTPCSVGAILADMKLKIRPR